MELKTFFAQDVQGNVVPNPTARLYLPDTTIHAVGLQDANGNPISNPFTGGANGQITVAAPDGDYDLRINAASRVTTIRVRFIGYDSLLSRVVALELAVASGYVPTGSAPVISGVPTITGTPEIDSVLTAVPAAATGSPTPARSWQWMRDGVDISGATSITYTLVEDDVGATVTVEQTEANATGTVSAASAGVDVTAALVPIPSGFDWIPPVNVYRMGSTYYTDYNPEPFLVEGAPGVTTFYVDGQTGNDSNPGTAASPKKSLIPISSGRVAKLLIKARGVFFTGVTSQIQTAHDELCVEAWGGAECAITTLLEPSVPMPWTDEGGGVWSAAPPFASFNGISVHLGTNVETMTRYVTASTLAECQATPGSVFRQTSPSLRHFVHTVGGGSPATGHTVYGTQGPAQSANVTDRNYNQLAAFHGVSFLGGDSAFHLLGDAVDYVKRYDFVGCSFKHATNFGVFYSSGTAIVIHYGCVAGPSRYDGFSYSTNTGSAGGNVPRAVEINCVGRNNGIVAGANQGSTTHFGGKVLRVNGQYFANSDQQIADVGQDTKSWNIACHLGPMGVGVGRAALQIANNLFETDAWLEACTFSGADLEVLTDVGGTVRYKNMPLPNSSGPGVVESYE